MIENFNSVEEFLEALDQCNDNCLECELCEKSEIVKNKNVYICAVNNKRIILNDWTFEPNRPTIKKRDVLLNRLKLEKMKDILQ